MDEGVHPDYGKLAGLSRPRPSCSRSSRVSLAGNPFGTILLRALLVRRLSSAALAVGLQYVVRRFLPELGGGAATEDGWQADGQGRRWTSCCAEGIP